MDSFNQKLLEFFKSRLGNWVAFVWGVCEATFFFIVPDVFFCLTALLVPGRGILHGFISILGSLVGGVILYQLAFLFPVRLHEFLVHVPGISQKMVAFVQGRMDEVGLTALLSAPLGGIPYKIYAVQAGTLHLDWGKFLLMTIPARMERILLVTILVGLLGKILEKNIKANLRGWLIIYGIFWICFYGFYAYFITMKY